MNFNWNPILYNSKHNFVYKYGEEIVRLLDPQLHETVLDLGCGTGDLTKMISDSCKTIIGFDNSVEMIKTARKNYPDILFYKADASDFKFNRKFDAVFSNAVLHWIPDAVPVIKNINIHLKTGGRFVAEFGGKKCNNNIISTITNLLDENRMKYPKIEESIYFPSISKYSSLLEQNGFEVNYAVLFDRPTPLKDGENGLNNFIEMFMDWLFNDVTPNDKKRIIKETNNRLRPKIFDGVTWIADYRRIRVIAVKKEDIFFANN
ncbi:MAG: class I SAM-dependent methyltransferase [Prolixibacteraceae bacterium]|nr:class I SAM-dependent methyltransferase [Prolixibacteraceae bacterium]